MLDEPRTRPTPRPGILDITPYKGGEGAVKGVDKVVKLSSNENCLGPSPKAVQAYQKAAETLALYPDGSASALRKAIGEVHDIDPERIVCGAGSDELLQLIARSYAGPGDEILFSEHGFLVYRLAAMQVGATPVAAPESDLKADVDALLARVTERTRVVFLANPNNPTGSYLSQTELERLYAGLPEATLLVIDGAYAEYVGVENYSSGVEMALAHDNVVATRTFSKIYGLASLRLGWMVAPAAVIDVINRMRGPFNVTGPALAAGEAALRDPDHAKRSADHNERELAYATREAERLGILARRSVGNFVLLRFAKERGKTAADADAVLKAACLILRRMEPYGLGDCLRLTLGARAANEAVFATLEKFLRA